MVGLLMRAWRNAPVISEWGRGEERVLGIPITAGGRGLEVSEDRTLTPPPAASSHLWTSPSLVTPSRGFLL